MRTGVLLVNADVTDRDLKALGPDAATYIFDVGGDQSAWGFYRSVMRSLPQDPPLRGLGGVNWEALDDSVWGGLATNHPQGGDVVIYWRDAARLKVADRDTYDIVLTLFQGMAESIGDVKYNPVPLRLLILVGDDSTPDDH